MARLILLLLTPSVAWADPISVTIFFAQMGMGSLGVFIANYGMTMLTVAMMGYGAYQGHRQRQKARDAYNKSLRDRTMTVRSAVSPRRYVLGTIRVGGTLVYADTIGTNKVGLDMVLAVCSNLTTPVGWYIGQDYVSVGDFPGAKYGPRKTLRGGQSIALAAGAQNVVFDYPPVAGTVTAYAVVGGSYEQLATSVSGSTVTVTVPAGGATVDISYSFIGAPAIYGVVNPGSAAQGTLPWGTNYPSPKWGANHKLLGTTTARTLMLWDEDVYQSGAPEISLVVSGVGIANPAGGLYTPYDPRTGLYLAGPTTNPALLAAWWRTLPRSMRGMGVPHDWIDWVSVAAAANVCDELITVRKLDGSGYEQIKRYECHTVLDTDSAPLDNLRIILSSMAGDFPFTAGKYRLYAGAFRPATLTIDDSMVVGTEPLTVVDAADGQIPNTVTATIADQAKDWKETSAPTVQNAIYLAEDGGEIAVDLPLPATTDSRQANYLMGVALERMRPALTCTLHVNGVGEDIALGRTVQLDLTNRTQYSGHTFEVVKITDKWNGTFDLTLRETRASTYLLDADRFTPINQPAAPDTSYLWNVAELAGFDVLDGQTSDGIDIAWDLHSQPYVRSSGKIELRYRELGDPAGWRDLPPAAGDSTGTTLTLALTRDATYEFQGRAINGVGATSPWAYEFATVVAAAGPSLNFIGEYATPPSTSGLPEGSVYRNSTDKDTYVLRSGAWQLFLEGGEDGAPGTAKLLRLLVTSNVFQVTQDGAGSPTFITLTAQGQNLADSPTFTIESGTVVGGLTGTGQTRTLNFSAMTTDAVVVKVAQDGLSDQVTILKVRDGSAAIASVLTNESHTIAADFEGDVASFADAVTWMKVYRGGTDDTANWSFSRTNSTGVSSTLTGSGADRGKVSIDSMTVDSGYVDITATRSGFPTQTKRFVLAKSKQGAVGPAGAGAKLLVLDTSSYVFQITKAGANNPASITFTASEQNLTGTLSWSITGGALTGTGSTRTLTFANMSGETATVTVTKDGQSDSVTVSKLREGLDGTPGSDSVVSLLTNEAHTVAADSAGTVTSGLPMTTDMDVFVGLVDDTINWSFSIVNSNVSATINNTAGNAARGRLTVTALSADTGSVTITATKSGHPTQVKTFRISKSRQGTPGTIGPNGTRGSAHAYLSGYSTWNTTTENAVNAYFTGTYGGKVTNDMVTVYSASTFTQTRIWTGSSWGVVTQAHDGTMLIDGSVPNSAMTSLASHGMSITPDPGFEDLSLWEGAGTAERQIVTWNRFGRYVLKGSGDAVSRFSRATPIDVNRNYRAIAVLNADIGATRIAYLCCVFYDANGDVIAGSTKPAGWPGAGSYHYFGIMGAQPPEGALTEYAISFGPAHTAQIPAGAVSVSIGALLHFNDGPGRIDSNYLCHARIQQLQDTELIAPNAATDVLVIRTAGYSSGGGSAGGIRVSGGGSGRDLVWTNPYSEPVDIIVRGSCSMAINLATSTVRVGAISILKVPTFRGPVYPTDIADRKMAVQTLATNGSYQGSGAPSYSMTVAAGETVQFDLFATIEGFPSADSFTVSDGQISLEVIKR